MDANSISTLISSIGFPIVMVLLIFWKLNKEQEDHKSEVGDLKNVISNMNETLAALKQLIQDKLQ